MPVLLPLALFATCVFFFQVIKQAVSELLTHSSSVAIMVKSERLCTTDPFVQVTFQRSNKDHTCKFTLQDFLHSNQKLKDEANKSRLENSLITACFCSHRWAICVTLRTERVLPRKIKFCKIWMNQGMWPVMWPWLAAGNRNIRNCTKQSSPSVSSVRAFAKQTMAVCRRISPPPPPRPSPLFWRVNLSLGIIFWLAPTLGQFARPNRSHCRVRLLCSDLRSGLRSGPIWAVRFFSVPCPPECYLQSETKIEHDLRTINELEKWCFEIIRT